MDLTYGLEAVADSNEEVAVVESLLLIGLLQGLVTEVTDTELSTYTYLEVVVLYTGTYLSTPVETIEHTIVLIKRLDVLLGLALETEELTLAGHLTTDTYTEVGTGIDEDTEVIAKVEREVSEDGDVHVVEVGSGAETGLIVLLDLTHLVALHGEVYTGLDGDAAHTTIVYGDVGSGTYTRSVSDLGVDRATGDVGSLVATTYDDADLSVGSCTEGKYSEE